MPLFSLYHVAALLLVLALPAAAAPDALSVPAEDTLAAPAEIPQAVAPPATVNYAQRPEVQSFVNSMAQKHGFEQKTLQDLFRQARKEPEVLKAILPPLTPAARSWHSYRARFIETRRIKAGLEFKKAHAATLRRATEHYGVPADIIVAIIGIETFYGRNMGHFQSFSALTTLAFDYPPRADLFRRELEELLLLARENSTDPLAYTGSFAGALGMPQFLPSSLRHYAVDFDGDGRIDLAGNPQDAIGSVASFLAEHGWQKTGPIAVPAKHKGPDFLELADGQVEPRYTPSELQSHGISASQTLPAVEKTALIDLATPDHATEYWLGFQNFYVITRYNRSSFYAMSVFQLAEKLRMGDIKGYKKAKPTKKARHAKARRRAGR